VADAADGVLGVILGPKPTGVRAALVGLGYWLDAQAAISRTRQGTASRGPNSSGVRYFAKRSA